MATSSEATFCAMRTAAPGRRRPGEPPRERVAIALCPGPITPTRFPWATSAQIIRAPVYVLPEPGGPWIARTVSSSWLATSIANASGSAPPGWWNVPDARRGGSRISSARAMPFASNPADADTESPIRTSASSIGAHGTWACAKTADGMLPLCVLLFWMSIVQPARSIAITVPYFFFSAKCSSSPASMVISCGGYRYRSTTPPVGLCPGMSDGPDCS